MSYNKYDNVKFEDLKGLVLDKIEVHNQVYNKENGYWESPGDYVIFYVNGGRKFEMMHYDDCCESVTIEDICGDLDDLIGVPILLAEEAVSEDVDPPWADGLAPDSRDDSFTWTFYKLATIKGNVTIRWFGTSNGYYSESVDFYEVKENETN